MPTQMNEIVRHLRAAVLRQDGAGLTDGQLLGRFIEQREEAAVATLVRRHGPMVWGVCRRILGSHHDAEDAFQATFLVLVRKAGSIKPRELVGNWLYGVAHQTALKARAMRGKRRTREKQVANMPDIEASKREGPGDLQSVLDQELSRLPEKYRVAIVLCDLEEKTRRQVARQLGLPEGTVAGRLTRGRAMLAKRLARHGLVLSGGSLAAVLAEGAASAGVPTSVMISSIRAATLVAAGQATAGLVSAKVAALSEGVLKAMFLTKLKIVAPVFLAAALLAFGAGQRFLLPVGALEPPGQGAVVIAASPQPHEGPGRRATLPRDAGPPTALVEHKSPVTCLAWSADGRLLASATEDGTVHVTQIATGKDRNFPTQDSAVTALAFSPDGKALELFNQLLRQSTWDADTGEQLGGHFQSDGHVVDHLAFMPGGKWVVGVSVEAFSKRQFVRSGPAEGRTRSGTRGEGCAAIAPDGTVSGFCDATGRLVVLQSGSADEIDFGDDFALDVGKARAIAFGPGGKLLAVGDDKGVQIWDLPARKKTRALTGLDQPAARLAISANGQTLVALSADGKSVLAWDPARSVARCQVRHNRGGVGALALSPDGKTLATAAEDGKAVFTWKLNP